MAISNEATTHANDNTNSTPVSKLGSKVWNYISSSNSNIVAKKMINDSTIYGNNKSGIITGTQWDTIMKWFEKDGITVKGTVATQGWGTYRELGCSGKGYYFKHYYSSGWTTGTWMNGSFSFTANTSWPVTSTNASFIHGSGLNLTSGYKKNIADLAGNLNEFTSEVYYVNSSSVKSLLRGGQTYSGRSSSMDVASSRCGFTSTDKVITCNYGFRVVLYVQ